MSTQVVFTEQAAELDHPIAVKLYDSNHIPGFNRGGLADMGEYLRKQGRYGDDILLHITPEEFRELKKVWGEPTINPATGLPEFFLGKIFKAVKKVVKAPFKIMKKQVDRVASFSKRLLKNPIFQKIAPIAMGIFLPGIGGLLAQARSPAHRPRLHPRLEKPPLLHQSVNA